MSGTDGTGPHGEGPMTGGRRGRCAGGRVAGRSRGTSGGSGCRAETGTRRGLLRAATDPGGLVTGATTRGLLALGASLAQDLGDPDGIARPLLRRTALHLTASRLATARRLAEVYLRNDPPTVDELGGSQTVQPLLPAAPDDADPPPAWRSLDAAVL